MQRTRPQLGWQDWQPPSQPSPQLGDFAELCCQGQRNFGMQTSSGVTFQQCFLISFSTTLGQQTDWLQQQESFGHVQSHPAGVTCVSTTLVASETGCRSD